MNDVLYTFIILSIYSWCSTYNKWNTTHVTRELLMALPVSRFGRGSTRVQLRILAKINLKEEGREFINVMYQYFGQMLYRL